MQTTTGINPILSILTGFLALLVAFGAFAQSSTAQAGTTLLFQGTEYQHRWSKQGRHEFTPKGQDNLEQWRNMLTINVQNSITSAEQLARVADNTLSLYEEQGYVLNAESQPQATNNVLDHFVAGVFVQPTFVEAAFTRFTMREGVGVVIDYSQRFYGEGAQDELLAWIEAKGNKAEEDLMSWHGLPTLKQLDELPQI